MDRVSVRTDGLPTRKYNVADISASLVRSLRTEHPGISPLQANIRPLEVKKREAEAIDASRRCMADPVIDREPAFRGLNRRRAQTDLVRVPPTAAPRFQDDLVASPVPQIRRERDPHMRAEAGHRPMDHSPATVN